MPQWKILYNKRFSISCKIKSKDPKQSVEKGLEKTIDVLMLLCQFKRRSCSSTDTENGGREEKLGGNKGKTKGGRMIRSEEDKNSLKERQAQEDKVESRLVMYVAVC